MAANIKKKTEKIGYYVPPKNVHNNTSEVILPESKLNKVFKSNNQFTDDTGNRGIH